MDHHQLEDIIALPKIDLHVHMSGLMDSDLAFSLLKPELGHFPVDQIKVMEPVGKLSNYLLPWRLLKKVPLTKRNLDMIVSSCFEHLIYENVKKVELRHTVVNISRHNDIKLEDALILLGEIISDKSNKTGIKAGLIISLDRSENVVDNGKRVIEAISNIGNPSLIVGLDLTGDENIPIDDRVEEVFREAKDELGLGITVHAGETGDIRNIYIAIEKFKADRIGHGTAAAKSPKLMELIAEKDVCIEVCPTSNMLSGAYDGHQHHPAKVFYHHEVPFVICSDNPQVHSKGLSYDYLQVYNEIKDVDFLREQYSVQDKYSFI